MIINKKYDSLLGDEQTKNILKNVLFLEVDQRFFSG